jgi:hypothetical protein
MQPISETAVMMRSEHNKIGGVLFKIVQNAFDRTGATAEYRRDIDSEVTEG